MRRLAAVIVVTIVLATSPVSWGQDAEKPWETWEPPVVETPVPNALRLYEMAFEMLEEFEQPEKDAAPEQLRAAIEGHDLAYQALQQAMMGECQFPALVSPEQMFPELAKVRNACRFMVTHARVMELDGQMAQAALDCIGCVRLGSGAASNGTLIGGLVAIACEAIGLHALEELIPGLQPDECHVAIEALRAARAERVPLPEVLEGEVIFGKMTMKRQFKDFKSLDEVDLEAMDLPPEELEAARQRMEEFKQQMKAWQPTDSWRAHEQWFGQVIEEAEKPYWQREQVPKPGDPLVDILVPVYARTGFKFALADARLRLALVQLAVQGYLLDKGLPPADLEALVPEYLAWVPDDPFADGQLKSTVRDGDFVIYSVGPDGVDDGGSNIEGFPEPDSTGDMAVTL